MNKQRHAVVEEGEIPCEHTDEVLDFASHEWQKILECVASTATLQKYSCQKNNIVYAAPTDIRMDFTSVISHVKSYALKYVISGKKNS